MPNAYSTTLTGTTRTRRERYGRLRTSLWNDRSSFDAHWRDIGDYILPRRTRFWSSDRNKGDKRNQKIIDSTAKMAARTLQSGLHAGLTSPARPWFKLTTPDPDLATFKPVQEWLHVVTQRLSVVITDTNLYNVLPIVYGDMGVFGTAAMGLLEDTLDLFRCYAYPLGSYAIGLDERGLATTFIRDYELTVRQVVKQFAVVDGLREIDWSVVSTTVKDAWDKGNYEDPVSLTWVVTPNEMADPNRIGSQYLPWASCHFEAGDARDAKKFLRESGFNSFPIMAPRWDITGEDTYGTDCPGMTVLGDVKQLQMMHRDKAKAIKKGIDPPVQGPPELRTQRTSLLPGDITYVSDRGNGGLKAVHEVRLDLDHLRQDIGETQYRIQRGFYEDLFLMLARSDEQRGAQPVTAREVAERHEEKLLALGPVLERSNDELLDPIINRSLEMMDRAGLLPPRPEALEGVKLNVEYLSILAQAQKLVDVVGQDRFCQTIGTIAQTHPEVLDKVDFDQVADNYADMLGVDPRILRSTEEAQAIRQQRAQQQQAQANAEQAALMAKAVKDGSEAKMGTDSALDRMVSAAGSTAVN